MLSATRWRKKLFRNIKYKIILDVKKTTICLHMKKNIWDLVVTKELGKTTKTVCSTKKKYLTKNQALWRRNGKLFCRKKVLVKAYIPPSISKNTVCRVLRKTDLKWTQFQGKGAMSKNDLKFRIKFAWKVYRKRATC